MRKMGTDGKIWAETIKNLDPSQLPEFVASITAKADKDGNSGLANMGRGMMDVIRRIGEGDEDAAAQLMGMWNAFAVSTATGVAVKGALPKVPNLPDTQGRMMPDASAVKPIKTEGLRLNDRGIPTRTTPVKAGARVVESPPVKTPVTPKADVKPPAEAPVAQAPKPKAPNTQPPVALANRSTDTIRKIIGLPDYEGAPKEKVAQWAKTATEKGYTDPANAHSIAKSVLDGTKKLLDDEESMGMASALHDLSGQFDDLSKQYAKSMTTGGDPNIAAQLDDVTQKLTDIVEAGNRSGAEWGRSGVARQALMKADGSFEGILSRRQKAAGRKLTADEVTRAKADAEELASLRKQIADYESGAMAQEAQKVARSVRRGGREQVRLERAEIHKEIDDILKSAAAVHDLGSATYQALRFGKAAGKLAVNYAKEGVVVLDELVEKVIKDFADRGVTGMTRQDVVEAMTEARKKKANERADGAAAESTSVFAQARQERQAALSHIRQKEIEAVRKFQGAEKKKAIDALRKERDEIRAEEKAAREAEHWYWADVRRQESDVKAALKKETRDKRDAAIRRWKGSVQGQRAQVLNRIDRLSEKLDFARSEGAILGQRSKLKTPEDPILNELRVKEASVQRQMRLEDSRIRVQQQQDAETGLDKAKGTVGHAGNLLRDAITMFDASWSGIQGALVGGMNPKAWTKGFGSGIKNTFAKGDDFVRNMESLRKDDLYFNKVVATGVELPGIQPELTSESFIPNALDRIPGYKNIKAGSKQGFDASATFTRYALVRSWIQALEKSGRPLTPEALKVLGEAANTLTGRATGDAGRAISTWKAVGQTLFAPSWWLSQYQVLTGKPLQDAIRFGLKTNDWRPTKLMLAEYGKLATETVGVMVATKLAFDKMRQLGLTDWQLETDIWDKRFGKIWVKRGDTVIQVDFLPPQIASPLKTLWQLIFGTRSKDGKVNQSAFARTQMLGSVFEGKYGPGVGTVVRVKDSIAATNDPNDETGKPKYPFGRNLDPRTGEGLKNLGVGAVTPISLQQGYGVVSSDKLSPGEKSLLGIMSFLGRGASVYKEN
jgi:hypothetical protein